MAAADSLQNGSGQVTWRLKNSDWGLKPWELVTRGHEFYSSRAHNVNVATFGPALRKMKGQKSYAKESLRVYISRIPKSERIVPDGSPLSIDFDFKQKSTKRLVDASVPIT